MSRGVGVFFLEIFLPAFYEDCVASVAGRKGMSKCSVDLSLKMRAFSHLALTTRRVFQAIPYWAVRAISLEVRRSA